MKNLRLVAAALLCLAVTVIHARDAFRVGEKAPEFRSGRWLNEGPITSFRPGQIYVLEFWATWCGPCIAAMPHLSELARKHEGKVTFIGVNILEKGTDPVKIDNQIDRFMSQGGKAMQYPVCRDTADLHLTKEWFERSGSVGIPATVVVDGRGNIAWLGHPSALDKPLEELLAGKFNYDAAGADAARKGAAAAAMAAAFDPVTKAIGAKDWPEVIKRIDEAGARDPRFVQMMRLFRYQALVHVNEAEAYSMLQAAMAEDNRGAQSLVGIVAGEEGLSRRMYELGLTGLGASTELNPMRIRAQLFFHLGRSAEAVELQRKVVAGAKAANMQPMAIDLVEDDLRKYERAAAEAKTEDKDAGPAPAQPVPAPPTTVSQAMEAVGATANDPDKLDQLLDRTAGEVRNYVAEVAASFWKPVYLDPVTSEARRKEAEGKLRKYAAILLASESTFNYQEKAVPMARWKGQGLIATIENSSPGKVLGNYGLTTMDRKPVSLAEHRGKVVMLDFWATWCKPCLESMPSVRAFADELKGKPFEVLGVNYGDPLEKAQAFHDSGKVPMPWTHLHQQTFTEEYFRWSLGSIPTYILLDEKGVVIARANNFDDDFKRTIRAAVAAVRLTSQRALPQPSR